MNRFPLLKTVGVLSASLCLSAAGWASAPPLSFEKSVAPLIDVPLKTSAAPDLEALRAEDAAREASRIPGPYRFAVKAAVDYRPSKEGVWQNLDDGSRLWRLRIDSPGALSLNLTLDRFLLPSGARLWVYTPDGQSVNGPYSHLDAKNDRLWTPVMRGDSLVVELHEPASVAGQSDLQITGVAHGYRGFFEKPDKQGACNNDVVCPEGDPWRDQIRSIVAYSLSGTDRCTGVLVNNTAEDGKPYILTAEHCRLFGGFPDPSFYFNFESPVCGALSGGSMAQSMNGATARVVNQESDFALLELDAMPPAAFNVYYSGWDASDAPLPNGVVGIHHPSVDEKAISFENDQVFTSADTDVWPSTHWRVNDWDDGTTEGGSSGSPIFDTQRRVVGTLSGGFAACGNNEPDWYGKMASHWARGLQQWLAPDGVTTSMAGIDNTQIGTTPGGCVESDTVRCLNNERFAVSIRWRDFAGNVGDGRIVTDSEDSSVWWFFGPNNWEMLVKVLDGCGFNGRIWVFSAAVTNVEYTLTVTDTVTNITKTYFNRLGVSASAVTDTDAFDACP